MGRRDERLQERITEEVAAILTGLKDPGMRAMVSVVRTELNRDRSLARVHLSFYGAPEAVLETQRALERARGHIRTLLARRLGIFHVPELVFVADDSIAFADRITRILKGERPGREEEET